MTPTDPNAPSPKFRRGLALILLLGLAFVAGIFYERLSIPQPANTGSLVEAIRTALERRTTSVDPTVFGKVWDAVKDQYVEESVGEQTLYYGAVRGVVQALGDRYSAFFDPDTTQRFKAELGEVVFDGIGAEIGVQSDALVIVAPLPGSPAEKAGVKAGDKILRIDETDTSDLTVDAAVALIRGKRGTIVKLALVRKDVNEPIILEIKRDNIVIESVQPNTVTTPAGASVAHIRVTHFTEDTPKLFQRAVTDILIKQPRAVIIDLRNNPGGYLQAAVSLASHFLDDGTVVVSEKNRSGPMTELLSEGTPALKGKKVLVLVNAGSASASEILAGALQDYEVATLIGEKTFGKGSVQTLDEFPDGSSLKLTIAHWLTPKGRSIQDQGIEPDVVVDEESTPDNDLVLKKALELVDAAP